MSDKKTLLIIDDNKNDRELYKRILNKNYNILEADNVQHGLTLYCDINIDCVLLDYRLDGDTGIAFIELINKLPHPFVPIIMLTGHGDEHVAVETMKAGATDYLIKDGLTEQRLTKAINQALERSLLIKQLREKTLELELMATTDSLTGLSNRRVFWRESKKRLAEAKRHHQTLAFLYIDLDDFKYVNDTYGHEAGDELLSLVAEKLKACLREEDFICRMGGDEFIVVAPWIQHDDDAPTMAKKIIKALSKPFIMAEKVMHISTCIGIAYSHDKKTIEKLLQEADLALYEAKRSGKGKYVVSST